jgi:hypothetical protein
MSKKKSMIKSEGGLEKCWYSLHCHEKAENDMTVLDSW